MNAITVGKALAAISAGWAALFSVAHTEVEFPIMETETETLTVEEADYKFPTENGLYGIYYPATGVITKLYPDTDTYTWEDFSGNIWEEKGIEDLCEGDRIALIMHNNGTPEIYDDYAVDIRYVGWEY